MIITFDKGTTDERSLEVDFFTEQILDNRLSGSWEKTMSADFTAPNLANFKQDFSTMEITSGGIEVPYFSSYTTVLSLNISYNDQSKMYSLTLIIV